MCDLCEGNDNDNGNWGIMRHSMFGSCSASDDIPTNVGITRATPTATPLVVISDGVKLLGCSGCFKVMFFHTGVRTSHH